VTVPGGREGTVVGIKTVYVQLDGVGSRNYVDVDKIEPAKPSPTLASGASTPRHQAKDGHDGALTRPAVPAPPTPCPTCDGAGELVDCSTRMGCSHVNDAAWPCRDCGGEGTQP